MSVVKDIFNAPIDVGDTVVTGEGYLARVVRIYRGKGTPDNPIFKTQFFTNWEHKKLPWPETAFVDLEVEGKIGPPISHYSGGLIRAINRSGIERAIEETKSYLYNDLLDYEVTYGNYGPNGEEGYLEDDAYTEMCKVEETLERLQSLL